MDGKMENVVLHLLNKIKFNRCTIIVTHLIKVARIADQIYILENGKIQSSGNHEELMQSENLYSMLFHELIPMRST
jgi:ATP-binding cassette subfamily B protein